MQYFVEPVTGFLLIDTLLAGDWGAFRSALSHLILPTIVLGTVPLAVIARMTRSAMLEVLGEDYIRTARAKGLPRFRVIAIHALRNALIPVVTVIGLQVGVLFTGAILTETIFSWPGVGKWLIEGINRRDYPVLQGGTLMIGAIVMMVNLLVDVTYGLINPRIRHTTMTAEVLETPATAAHSRNAAASAVRVLVVFPRQCRRGRGARRDRRAGPAGALRRPGRAAFADPHQQHGLPQAAVLAGGRIARPIRSAPTRSAATSSRG